MKLTLLFATLLTGTFAVVYGQSGCASDCFSDVSMSNCNSTSNWPCLCKDATYVDYVNTCIMSSCNSTDDRLGAYYTLSEICQIFGVTLTGPEASAKAAASTSSISGLPTDIVSLSAYSSALLTGPGIASFTSAASSGSEVSAASTLSSMNPGGPMQSASSGSVSTTTNTGGTMISASSGTITSASGSATDTVQGGAAGSTQPGGPVMSATSASSASASGSTQPGGPMESATGAASSASLTSASATASAASAANIVRPGCAAALVGIVGYAVLVL